MSARKRTELSDEQIRKKISDLQDYYCKYCTSDISDGQLERCKTCSIGAWITGLINALKAKK